MDALWDALWITEDENRALRKAIALALAMYEHRLPRLPDFEDPDEDDYLNDCVRLHQLERRLLWLQGEGTVPTKGGNKNA